LKIQSADGVKPSVALGENASFLRLGWLVFKAGAAEKFRPS
jgi:hypothetical protein